MPITKLNFGLTQASSGIHTLGRLECSGIVAVTELPTSCKDLWLIGHTLNGIFPIMGSAMTEFVYCDFIKLPGDEGKYFFSRIAQNKNLLLIVISFYNICKRISELDRIRQLRQTSTGTFLRPEKF